MWNDNAFISFHNLKEFLSMPLVLTALDEDEVLLLYIATTNHVVSTVLVVERGELGHAHKVQ
jgi:hypothetical protein